MNSVENEVMQLIKVFVAAALAAAMTYGGSVLTLGVTEWRGIVAAGVAAVLVAAYRYITNLHATDLPTDLLLVFGASVLGQLAAFGTHVLLLGSGEWKAILGAALAAVMVAAYNWLVPTSNAPYGVKRDKKAA